MKFLCDQMLVRMGRWLRAAGYDTVIVENAEDDKNILKQAIEEHRLLITRDKDLRDLDPQGKNVIWLEGNSTQACVQELSKSVSIDWLHKPFSRCLQCNTPLEETSEADIDQVSEAIRKTHHRYWVCPQCGKFYWEGTHTKRMLKQLEQWHKRPF
jgi:uncharacterized protein